jgi:hypothetical protein
MIICFLIVQAEVKRSPRVGLATRRHIIERAFVGGFPDRAIEIEFPGGADARELAQAP